MPLKKAKQEIRVLGRKKGKDACPNCIILDKKIRNDLPKAPIPTKYKFVPEGTKEGDAMSKKYKVKLVPFVEKCTTYTNGKSRCKIIR